MDPKDIEAYWKRITDEAYRGIEKAIGLCSWYDGLLITNKDSCPFGPCTLCGSFIQDPEVED